MEGFPQFARSAKLGNLGVSIVSAIVDEKFGWLFRRIHQEHDFGIDGQIDVVTEEGFVTGQMLGCQIKNGPSHFGESNRWGYVYRGKTKHFSYLASCPLPVLIIICEPETREGFWVRFRADEAQRWIREKVDKGMADDTEHGDLNFVSIGPKAAICRPESHGQARDQIDAEFNRVCALEQAIRRAGIQARDQIGDCFAGPQDNGHCNACIRIRVGVNVRERKLMHCLPAAEGQISLRREMCQQRPIHSGRPGRRTDGCKFVTVSDQTAAVKRHPLTGIRTRFFCEPLKFFAALVDRSDRCSAILRRSWIFKRQAHPLMFG
jgi:hypothetical protein